MNTDRDFERVTGEWLDAGSDSTPSHVIDAVLLAVRTTPQERDFRIPWRTLSMRNPVYAAAVIAVLAVAGVAAVYAFGPRLNIWPAPTPTEEPSVDLGIFEPVAGRIVYRIYSSVDPSFFAVDPSAPLDRPTRVQLTSEGDIPLGWSSDGTRLLIMRGSHLFVVHADGSETLLTAEPMAIRGATISPDGSRVVFAGGTGTSSPEGGCCARFALYAVDADGGPVEMLVESRIGILDDLSFSPDGTRIAYADGAGDNNHHVWVMNADGSDAHEIVSKDCACHVSGLAWSPAGDRIALGLEGTIYTFAPDGSGFRRVITQGDRPYWSPDGLRFAYTRSCVVDLRGCGLAIADADGSNVLTFGSGASGPWHPATLEEGPGG